MTAFPMHVVVSLSGILCLLLAGGLAGIGQHDGVLADPMPNPLPADGTPVPLTVRATVTGAALSGTDVRERLATGSTAGVTLPRALDETLATPETYVPVHIDGAPTDGPLPVLVRVPAGSTPATGHVLVLEGELIAYTVLAETEDGALRATSLVLFVPDETRDPLLFD